MLESTCRQWKQVRKTLGENKSGRNWFSLITPAIRIKVEKEIGENNGTPANEIQFAQIDIDFCSVQNWIICRAVV